MSVAVRKQLLPVADSVVTGVCAAAAGQVREVDEPYDTLNGEFAFPPFHYGCRSISAPWLPGFPTVRAHVGSPVVPPPPAGAQLAGAGAAARRSAARAASAARRRAARRA